MLLLCSNDDQLEILKYTVLLLRMKFNFCEHTTIIDVFGCTGIQLHFVHFTELENYVEIIFLQYLMNFKSTLIISSI